jgi:hypothetical protein
MVALSVCRVIGFQIKNGKPSLKRFYRETLDAISPRDEFSMNYREHNKTVVLRLFMFASSKKNTLRPNCDSWMSIEHRGGT